MNKGTLVNPKNSDRFYPHEDNKVFTFLDLIALIVRNLHGAENELPSF